MINFGCTISVIIAHIHLSENVQQMYSIGDGNTPDPAIARLWEGEARVDSPRSPRNARFLTPRPFT